MLNTGVMSSRWSMENGEILSWQSQYCRVDEMQIEGVHECMDLNSDNFCEVVHFG